MSHNQLVATATVWLTWFGIFLLLEIPAIFSKTPWWTLSDFVWWLEGDWHPFTAVVLIFFAWLLVHLVAKWVI